MSRPISSVRGALPVATSSSSPLIDLPPASTTVTSPVWSRDTRSVTVLRRTVMPRSSKEARTASPAKSSVLPRSRSSRTISVTSSLPSVRHASAISHATTPPPMMISRRGTAWALVASWLVHAWADSMPGIGGIDARLPVQIATALRAVSVKAAPSGGVTMTRRSPSSRPLPRARSMCSFSSHCTCPSSFQWDANLSRRRRTASLSIAPVTACRAPSTACAARSACPLRSSALLGMHAQ